MKWSEEDIKFLRENYDSKISLKDLSKYFRRSIISVKHKAARLGLSRPTTPTNKPKDKNYRNKYDKRYYEQNKEIIYRKKLNRRLIYKREMVDLLGGKCNNCGYKKSLAALEFHHKNDDKENMISILLKNSSKAKVLKEAEKCILLCANCHRELHNKGMW